MANYETWARSNSFKVKDLEGLKKSLDRFSGLKLEQIQDNLYVILPDEDFNTYIYTNEETEFEDYRLDPKWITRKRSMFWNDDIYLMSHFGQFEGNIRCIDSTARALKWKVI